MLHVLTHFEKVSSDSLQNILMFQIITASIVYVHKLLCDKLFTVRVCWAVLNQWAFV